MSAQFGIDRSPAAGSAADFAPGLGADSGADSPPPPRIRWAAVVWGCFFLVIALGSLWIVADDTRRDLAATWIGTLTPGAAVAYLGLLLGLLLLIGSLGALIRRAQHGGA